MNESPQELKQQAMKMMARVLPWQRKQLKDIEPRLLTYYESLSDETTCNLYEILGALKTLRMLRTYPLSKKKIYHAIQFYEGRWDGVHYIEGSGGMRFNGLGGFTHYRMQPWQVYVTVCVFGFHRWTRTGASVGDRELLKTERLTEDGEIEDWRRMVSELVLYMTRKSGKTQYAAFLQAYGFMFWDPSYEGYCCANSEEQAKILFSTVKAILMNLDPKGERIRFTAKEINWKPGQLRTAKIMALSAGGKRKDGTFPQQCSADEFGSAEYTNGKSDMLDLVNVVCSGMGPRRESLKTITTTAGYAVNGPFAQQLDVIMKQLVEELTYGEDCTEEKPQDYQVALLLQPDPWEWGDEERLLTDEKCWRKANKMIGVSVQPTFYEQQAVKAQADQTERKEFITKLCNVYMSNMVKAWTVSADDIRKLQKPMKITDCLYSHGWSVFVGLDFSGGDDLFAMSMMAVNYSPGLEMSQRFFADTYIWVLEDSMMKSPNRALYEQWVEKGWLRVCPGKVFNPDFAIDELMALNTAGVNLVMFGYDPAQSRDPINTIKAWLQTLGIQPALIKEMVVPVPQGFMTMNPLVQKLERMVLRSDPWLRFSENAMWPWMFGNCRLVYSRDETLCRVQKSGANKKIDGVPALLNCLHVFDITESRVNN